MLDSKANMDYSHATITNFLFFTLLTSSFFHFSLVLAEPHLPTANPSKSLSIEQQVAKIRALAPDFKSVHGIESKDDDPSCTIVLGLPPGIGCEDVKSRLGISDDVFNAINPNIDCDDLFVGQWICVIGTP